MTSFPFFGTYGISGLIACTNLNTNTPAVIQDLDFLFVSFD